MTTKTTIKDIAKKAGVSHATVSMVFSGEKRISEKTRNKVLSVANRLRYVPNIGASSLRRGESKVIGFVVNDIANPVYGKMAQVAESLALANGYQVIIADHQWNPEAEVAAIKKMISFRAKGLLWCSTEQSHASLDLLTAPGAPSVVALDSCPRDYNGSFLGYDVETTGRMAARHLVENGCRNPVLFTVNERQKDVSSFVDLQKGFLDELRLLKIGRGESRVFYAGLTIEEGRETFHRMMASSSKVDGIFAINDLCAYGVFGGADETGVQIGKDIALMGIGNQPVSSIPRISLTSISHSPDQIVKMAMAELLECFEQDRQPKLRVIFPSELIIRQSSRLSSRK